MLPFIHVGHWQLGTYGICLVTGFFVGFFILRAELERRHITQARPLEIVFALGICALLSSKLYFVLQHPAELVSQPRLLFGPTGFTFYGGLLGDMIVLVCFARRYRLPLLSLFDTLSVACALGYGIGRIGCFFAGDGDYGIATSLPWGMSFPRGIVPTTVSVHPAPLYEFLSSAAIAYGLWRLGSPLRRPPAWRGEIFAYFLLATGIARFLVEFIKRNPKVLFGLVNAQWVALLSIGVGLALLWAQHRRSGRRTDFISRGGSHAADGCAVVTASTNALQPGMHTRGRS